MRYSASCKHLFYILFLTLLSSTIFYPVQNSASAQESDSSAPVILTIEPSKDRKPISPYLYGVNIANWCSWYYMHMLEQRLRDARVEVVRLGATNMERYNFKNNRMYNVIARQNDYVALSWESFVEWTHNDLNTEPFLMVPVFGNVASDSNVNQAGNTTVPSGGSTTGDESYSHVQSQEEVMEWVKSAGDKVRFWGIGNEPWIAWKRSDYPLLYSDAAHGDQVLNSNISYDYYFNRFATVAKSIKAVNPESLTLGPTSANWFLYWFNDYSPICPVTEPGGNANIDDPAWQIMAAPESTFDKNIFPDRGGQPEVAGWETDPQKILPQYLQRMRTHEVNSKERIADYIDVHRYIRCITDYDAIQEPRGLFQKYFASWDMETLFNGVKTNLLNRLNSAVDIYYPGTLLSFSEYEYFYWDGHPSIPQVAAVGNMDFLGFFARGGVALACNWYVGEPNQAGSDLTHARRDSAMQAMFDEKGNPNPKYWAFYMMSNLFRGISVKAEASDWNRFSVHACENDNGDYVVLVVNKGGYDFVTGDYIPNQAPVNAVIDLAFPAGAPADTSTSDSLSNSTSSASTNSYSSPEKFHLVRLLRYGLDDPYVVEMDTTGIEMESEGRLSFDFHPLAIYAFVFSRTPKIIDESSQVKTVMVTPETIHFAPYETGKITNEEGTIFTHAIKITNAKQGSAPWAVSISQNSAKDSGSSWLTIEGNSTSIDAASGIVHGNSSGRADVTDSIYLTVNRTGLAPGTYEANISVDTGEESVDSQNQQQTGSVNVRVFMDVVPGEESGEKRIADFETGSLAHTLNTMPPYSIGWWDGHGAPNDRTMPYLYEFYIDRIYQNSSKLSSSSSAAAAYINAENNVATNRLGGEYCMKIEFDRKNADTESGSLYQGFGTYGHANATGNWKGYDTFEFDIRTETVDSRVTELLMILSDQTGNKGKPAINLKGTTYSLPSHTELMAVEDGPWQTVSIPLNGHFFDWRYPDGQNGSETIMDFSAITQIELVPWSGDATKKGSVWLDNLRLTGADGNNNHFPVAVIEKKNILVLPGKSVTLNGSQSYDPDQDGDIIKYRWVSSITLSYITSSSTVQNSYDLSSNTDIQNSFYMEKLSDNTVPSPQFLSSEEGLYSYDLIVTDKSGLESRNIAQVMVRVSKDIPIDGDNISIGGGAGGEGCFITTAIASGSKEHSSNRLVFLTVIALLAIAGTFMIGKQK